MGDRKQPSSHAKKKKKNIHLKSLFINKISTLQKNNKNSTAMRTNTLKKKHKIHTGKQQANQS